jgi:hypothetical protein
MKTTRHFLLYFTQFSLEREMFQTKAVEEIETHLLCSVTFLRMWCRLWDNVGEYCRAGQATDDNITRRMHIVCWIPNAAPRRSILLCNISYCTIILTVYGSYWKVVQYVEWIKNGLIFIAQYGIYCIVCGQHCAISLQSLSKGRAVNIFASE